MRANWGRARRIAPLSAMAAGIGLLLIGLPWAPGDRAQGSCQGPLGDLLAALPMLGLPSAGFH
jgi:hypothetical protein